MRQILNIAYYEIVHILRSKILLLMVFVVPVAYAALFGVIYVSGILTDIPVGVVDLDNSALSREVTTAFSNSPKFEIKEEFESYAQLRRSVEEGRVRAGVIIPQGFEQDAALNRGTEVLIVYDASNLICGYNIRKNALEVINEFYADRAAAYLAGLGMDERAIRDTLDAVSTNFEIWYNPTLGYTTFIYMGLVMMIIHQIGLLLTAISVTRDKEGNSWLQYLVSYVSSWKIYLGKSLPYFVTNMFNYALLILLSAELFNVKIVGDTTLIILLGIVYNIVIVSIGFCISVYARDSLQVTRYIMLLSTPFFMVSGFTWPGLYIPGWVDWIGKVTPFSWMVESFRIVTVKSLGIEYIWRNAAVLCIMAAISVFLCISFSKRNKPDKEQAGAKACEEFTERRGMAIGS
jgi:ABC-2 type transport system permease protein